MGTKFNSTVCSVNASGSDNSAVSVHHNTTTSFYHFFLLPLLRAIIFFFHAVSIFRIIPSPAQPLSALHCKKIYRCAQPEVDAHRARTHTLEQHLIRPDLQAGVDTEPAWLIFFHVARNQRLSLDSKWSVINIYLIKIWVVSVWSGHYMVFYLLSNYTVQCWRDTSCSFLPPPSEAQQC